MLSHSAWPHRASPSTVRFIPTTTVAALARAQSDESGIEPGRVATVTGSLASLSAHPAAYDEQHYQYDTDHTDLGSEADDEREAGRELLRDPQNQELASAHSSAYKQWRQFFDKYDPEGFGEIPWTDFLTAMTDQEFRQRVNTGKREILLEKSRTSDTHAITFQEFVNVIQKQTLQCLQPA